MQVFYVHKFDTIPDCSGPKVNENKRLNQLIELTGLWTR